MAITGRRFKFKMIIIGITGSFGTGKSTVASLFAKLGVKVLDADKLTHKIMGPGGITYRKILRLFGEGILKKDGSIDRRILGRIVFSDRKALNKLIKLIHPQVIKLLKEEIHRIKKEDPCAIVAIDAPLLIEAGLLKEVDKLIVVQASRKEQFKRCAVRNGMTKIDIARRIASQMPLKSKVQLADYVIDNNGSLSRTKSQVRKIWLEIGREIWT
ncbi:MAG: dephospho-CoA kinase [Candidatus Omnitrophica bacterium]|nr:dephospho-CoA kinase [Candidatus Omnitrophota bacterium]